MPKAWNKLDIDRVRKAAAMYHSNTEAARAMGIYPASFARACRENGIEQPGARKKRLQAENRNLDRDMLGGTK